MRKLLLPIVALAVVPAFSQDFESLMQRYHLSWPDAAIAGGFSSDFGIDTSRVLDYRNRFGDEKTDDLISALYMSKLGRRDVSDVYKMRSSGMSWGRIAKDLGIRPSDLNKINLDRARDKDIVDAIWRDRLTRNGLSDSDINWARKRGLDWEDVFLGSQLARGRKIDFRGSIKDYDNRRKWEYVRTHGMRSGGAWDPRYDDKSLTRSRKRNIWNDIYQNLRRRVGR